MKRSQAFPSKYLSKDDINQPTIATIGAVVIEVLTSDDEEKNKSVMYFSDGVSKPMIINVSNWITLEDLYGEESDNWIGKPIEIWVDPSVMYGGKRIGGLRLRAPAKQNGNGQKPTSPADVTTAFWAYAYQHDISKVDATAYLTEAQNDFARALALMQAQNGA